MLGDDYKREQQKAERKGSYYRWTKQRLETLKENVSAHDVLRYFGVDLKTDGSEEQISCPFHGDDRKPSARVFPAQGDSTSGVYCWTCQERWDIVKLWKMFHGDTEMKFTTALRGLESAFRIVVPDAPEFEDFDDEGVSAREEKIVELRKLLRICDNRLREGKPYFNMSGFLTLGALLDGLYYALEHDTLKPDVIERRIRMVLDKIGEKIRV